MGDEQRRTRGIHPSDPAEGPVEDELDEQGGTDRDIEAEDERIRGVHPDEPAEGA